MKPERAAGSEDVSVTQNGAKKILKNFDSSSSWLVMKLKRVMLGSEAVSTAVLFKLSSSLSFGLRTQLNESGAQPKEKKFDLSHS